MRNREGHPDTVGFKNAARKRRTERKKCSTYGSLWQVHNVSPLIPLSIFDVLLVLTESSSGRCLGGIDLLYHVALLMQHTV